MALDQNQNSAHPRTSPLDGDGVQLNNVTWYPYPYYDIGNAEWCNWNVRFKPNRKEQYQIIQHTVMATQMFGKYVS